MTKILIQTQLSNYDARGKFILEADSGWQMCMGRVREIFKILPDVQVDVMGPHLENLITSPYQLNADLFETGRLKYIPHNILPNALATRYDFHLEELTMALDLSSHKNNAQRQYQYVYINDPMHLRTFKALFYLKAGYVPQFIVHSHFVDVPECPKFPVETSLWLGQCEAAIKADYNFWQCESAMEQFFDSMSRTYLPHVVQGVKDKSEPWDDGYSAEEISSPINYDNLRFNPSQFTEAVRNKVIIFIPNRIGGRGRSSDYTACGKFMFELLPQLSLLRDDYVVIAGNPSQKFSNSELEFECGPHGYLNMVPDALNRDEFKYIVSKSHISLGLYREDTYGGTASRECVEMGTLPLWLDIYEYSRIIAAANNGYPFLCKPDFSDLVSKLSGLIDYVKANGRNSEWSEQIRAVVRDRCSYESTTRRALTKLGLVK